jgi:hypothetical protein
MAERIAICFLAYSKCQALINKHHSESSGRPPEKASLMSGEGGDLPKPPTGQLIVSNNPAPPADFLQPVAVSSDAQEPSLPPLQYQYTERTEAASAAAAVAAAAKEEEEDSKHYFVPGKRKKIRPNRPKDSSPLVLKAGFKKCFLGIPSSGDSSSSSSSCDSSD